MRNRPRIGGRAMSLYYHVANKEAVLDGVLDVVMDEINVAVSMVEGPPATEDWKANLRARILAAQEVLIRRWAPRLIETRTSISPATMRYFDDLLGVLRGGGFSYDLAHHALHALGSRGLGFTQELFEPENADEADEEMVEAMAAMADQFPHLTGMMIEVAHDDPIRPWDGATTSSNSSSGWISSSRPRRCGKTGWIDTPRLPSLDRRSPGREVGGRKGEGEDQVEDRHGDGQPAVLGNEALDSEDRRARPEEIRPPIVHASAPRSGRMLRQPQPRLGS